MFIQYIKQLPLGELNQLISSDQIRKELSVHAKELIASEIGSRISDMQELTSFNVELCYNCTRKATRFIVGFPDCNTEECRQSFAVHF